MSLVKRQLKIQRTLDFLEREEEAKERRRRRRAEREEANRHKKNVLVVDSGRPVYFWHWKVHKNTCRHGYLFINTLYRINSGDQIVQVDDARLITGSSASLAADGSNHTPHPPDSPAPSHTPRPPDSHTFNSPGRASNCSASITVNVINKRVHNSSHASAPLGNSTPRHPDNRKNHGRHGDEKNQEKRTKSPVARGKGRIMVSTLRGMSVIARNDKDGLYYPGKVLKCPNVRHATVMFTDGEREVLTRFILPVSGAVACPPLSVGDYALVQVVNMEQATECYVPCIVQFTPQLCQTQAQFYTVMLYNGQKVTTRRIHLVKISKERFELSARYISAVQGEDRAEVDSKVYVSQNEKKSADRRERGRKSHKSPERSPSASSEELRLRSRTPSRSRSRSRSRSPASPQRPRSPTPGVGLRKSPSPPRSSSASPRRQEMMIVGRKEEEIIRKSEHRIRSHSRSRSPASSPSQEVRSHPRSGSRSRSRSPSPDIKSKGEVDKKRSSSRTGSRSSSRRSSDGSFQVEVHLTRHSQKRYRSRSRSRSPTTHLSERQKELERLKKQLEKQQDQQARERKRLRRKTKKLSRMVKQLMEEKKESPDQDKGAENELEEEEGPLVTPRLLHLRRTLPRLQVAEEVLARFSDDGWYYRGTVQQDLGDLSYIVEDATGHIERIWREDIISDYDDNAPPLREEDRVVAQHPSHSGSFAPGSVLAVDEVLQTATIKFYDGQEGTVSRAEVYRLPQEKYNHDVLHIQQRQQSMLGLSVVARDDNTGEYFPGQVKGVEEQGRQFIIRWTNGSQGRQLPVHIFSAMTRRPRLLIGDRVLAVADPDQVVFLPGQIIGAQDSGLVVRFCDGQVRNDVNPMFCYWLSHGYFEEAAYFWKISQPDFGKQR